MPVSESTLKQRTRQLELAKQRSDYTYLLRKESQKWLADHKQFIPLLPALEKPESLRRWNGILVAWKKKIHVLANLVDAHLRNRPLQLDNRRQFPALT